MTGRWVPESGPSVRSVFLACPEATGRWESPVSDDRTRPVAEKRRWNLSVSDRTLGFTVRSVRALPTEGVTAILALGAIKEVCGRPWAGCLAPSRLCGLFRSAWMSSN